MYLFFKSLPHILSRSELIELCGVSLLLTLVAFLEVAGIALIAFVVVNLGYLDSILKEIALFTFIVDFLSLPGKNNYSLIFCTLIIIYAISTVFLSIFIVRYISLYSQNIGVSLRQKLALKYISMNWEEQIQLSPSENIARLVNDSEQTGDSIYFAMHLFSKFILAVLIIIMLLIFNAVLTIILVGILGASYFFLYNFFDSLTKANSRTTSSSKDSIVRAVKNMFGSLKEISFYGNGFSVVENINIFNKTYAQAKGRNMAYAQMPRFIIDSLILIILISILITMHLRAIEPNLFFSTISVFGIASLKLLPAFQNIFYFAHEINTRIGFVENIGRLSILKEGKDLNFSNKTYVKINSIEFKNISFQYPTSQSISLRNINLKINKGEKIAIFGESGSGKSTFIDILLGFVRPKSGKIEVNGDNENMSNFSRDDFAYVPQKIYFLEASLRDNILFGSKKSNFSEGNFTSFLQESNLDELIRNLPLGLDTIISDETQLVSGGQKQLIGLIRAMFKGGDILILDEATSAMDLSLERKVYDKIFNSKFNTIISVTHKISILDQFDRIFLFQKGEVIDSGSFDELKEKHSIFHGA